MRRRRWRRAGIDAAGAARVAGGDAGQGSRRPRRRSTTCSIATSPSAARARAPQRTAADAREGEGAGRGGEGAGQAERSRSGGAADAATQEQRERRTSSSASATSARASWRAAAHCSPSRSATWMPREVEALRELVAELSRRLRVRWSRRAARADARRARPAPHHPPRPVARRRADRAPASAPPRPGKSGSAGAGRPLVLDRHRRRVPARPARAGAAASSGASRCSPTSTGRRAVSFEGGHVVPHEPLDLNARSDFGAVLRPRRASAADVALGRNTVLLILGDARNNRRPPRADLLAAPAPPRAQCRLAQPRAARRAGTPATASWRRTTKHCDAVLPAWSPRTLDAALGELTRL